MRLRLLLPGLLLVIPAYAAVPKVYSEVVTTDRVDFAAGGVIRIEGSYGELNIDAWDQPQVDIVVTRFAYSEQDKAGSGSLTGQELNALKVTASKTSDKELLISTPRHKHWSKVRIDYRIMVPRSSKLVIHHQTGDVLIGGVNGDGFDGDIDASVKMGDILLRLPRTGTYSFDADCREGGVVSEFAGGYKRTHLIGEKYTAQNSAAVTRHNHLHVGIGGIQIQATTPYR
jgi:hypothetical protein